MKILRTPSENFLNLKDYSFKENYIEYSIKLDSDNLNVRMHYLDENKDSDDIVLLLHGEPTWSYLYRHMIPILVKAGKRVIAPDLIGFGKSDKFESKHDYSYKHHVDVDPTYLQEVIGDFMNNNDDQEIKAVVAQLIKDGHEEGINNNLVYRPWGNFISLAESFNWKVKRIEIKVGASISLQLHKKRSEHWIIVEGNAKIEIDGQISFLGKNEGTYIPLGSKHRLSNPGKIKLILIEVQSGSYVGELSLIHI